MQLLMSESFDVQRRVQLNWPAGAPCCIGTAAAMAHLRSCNRLLQSIQLCLRGLKPRVALLLRNSRPKRFSCQAHFESATGVGR